MSADRALPEVYDVLAPDGFEVRLLAASALGSMAHFTLPSGQVSLAVVHRSVEEIWYVIAGQGHMWRKAGDIETVTVLTPGLSLIIPVGTQFQFRNDGADALKAVAVTLPPWPGMDEAVFVEGKW
jgi:mannose-6-phosphate isomerase-like protein (cupin superfamily)